MKYEGFFDTWVSIFEATTEEEATIVKGMLENSQVPVVLDRDSVGDANDLSNDFVSEVVVKVPKDMVSKAAQLLQTKQFGARQEF